MTTIPAPANEEGRLRALRELKIVGTEPSSEFDALVQLACSIFDCPVALVSFIEKDYQWFKARQGLANVSTPRKLAFCNYTILSDKIFVVSDATRDKRFKHNALVTGDPGIRFYAGCPISIDGENNIGTICIIDKRPRRLSKRQKDQLAQMGRAVEGLVKAHQNEIRAVEAAVVAMDQTRVAETRNRLLLQIEKFASIGAWQLDLETNAVMWSDEVFRLHDLPVGQMPSLDAALGFYPGAARDLVVNSIKQTINSGTPYSFETDFITAKGRMRRVRSMGEIELKDGVPKKLFGVFEDVTHRYEVEQRLWKLAYVDQISSIANRAQFQQRFAAMLDEAEEKKTELSLFLLDLDRFKEVNDTMGHHAGDEVIKTVAERITTIAGPQAFCARLGGDEFAILANITSAEGSKNLANRIQTALRTPILIGDQYASVSASIGIARYPLDARTSPELLKSADLALYNAKKAGAGSACIFSPAIGDIFDARRHAIETVKRASMAGRIVPFYQPKVNLATRNVYGFEALVRIKNADGSIMGPQDFWQAFSDAECSRQINQHMLRAISEDIAEWRAAGLDPGVVSINASEFCFQDGNYAERILASLNEMGVPPEKFEIEITETVFLGEGAKLVEAALRKLNDAGCSIALDDFGTGYASLTHLRDFPIDHIKIDKSFVSDFVSRSRQSTVIVKAIVDLAHNLGMQVVAEGVETEGQYEFLRAIGCDSGQGFLFGHAVPAHRIVECLSTRRKAAKLRA